MLGTSSLFGGSFGVCLVWEMPCRQRGGVACSAFVLFGAGEEGGGIEEVTVASPWLLLHASYHLLSFLGG